MRPGSRAGIASRVAACHRCQRRQKELQHSTWRRSFGECVEDKGEVERLPLVQNAAQNLDLHTTLVVWRLSPGKHHLDSPFFLPTPSLFMVRFVMTRCSAWEFCSQAFTFLGNRRLLVTTVHLGACRQLPPHEHHNMLRGGSSQHGQS